MDKKLFLGMFAAAGMLFATSCSNDELEVVQSGNEAQVTFSLGLEGSIGSRAAISDGTKADKLVYAVYKLNDQGKPILQNVVGSTNGQFIKDDFQSGDNVSITLAKGQTYQVAFWAQDGDCKAYNTSDLTAVSVSYKAENGTDNAVNNDELRDAFFKMVEFEVAGNKSIDVVLKRPFAQINVGVNAEDWKAAVASGIEIENSKVVIKNAATSINLLTGAVSGPTDITYDLNDIPTEILEVDTDKDGTKEKYNWLSMSYILAADNNSTDVDNDGTLGDDRTTLESLQFTFAPKSGNAIVFKEGLNSVPVQRNWRTNILGKILTGDIQFNITIDPVYDGDIIFPEGQAQELEFAAKFGGTVTLTDNVELTAPLDVAADMILNMNGKTITGALNVAEGVNLTVENGTIEPIENLYVNGITSNGNLTLNNVNFTSTRHAVRIESGSAVINGGTYQVAPISNSTLHALHVGDDGTVANVTIKGGTFRGAKGTMADSGAAVSVKAGSTVTIEGGNFSGGKNNTLQGAGTMTITSGTFDQEPKSEWVAEGYKVIENNGTYYVVAEEVDAVVTSAEILAAALTADDENIKVILDSDIELPISSLGTQTGGSGEYKLGGENTQNITIDLNGKKLNITTTYWSVLGAKNENALFTIKNGTMTSSQPTGTWNSYDLCFANCNYNFENVTFDKAIALEAANKSYNLKNVIINETHDYYAMWVSAKGQTLNIDNLTINSSAGRGIKIDEQYVSNVAKVTMNISNATFKTAKKGAIVVKSVEGAIINVSNLNINEVTEDDYFAVWVDEDSKNYAEKVIVNGAKKVVEGAVFTFSNPEEFTSATIVDNATIFLGEGNYTIPAQAKGKTLTIEGNKDVVITVNKPAMDGGNLVLNGVTVKGSGYATGVQHVNTVTYNDVKIIGEMCLYGEKVVFNNCEFELNAQYIWTYGAKNVEFNNCLFNTTGKAILVYNEGAGGSNVKVEGCTFNATVGAMAGAIANQNCAAIEIDNFQNSGIGANHKVTTKRNTFSNHFSGEWRIKNYMNGNVITVNGKEYTSLAIDGKTMTIDASKNVTVE